MHISLGNGIKGTKSPFDLIHCPSIDYCLRSNFKHFFYAYKKKYEDEKTIYMNKKYKFTSYVNVFEDPEYKQIIANFLNVMRDPSIHKHLYRKSKDSMERYRLMAVFRDCGYVNYSFHFLE